MADNYSEHYREETFFLWYRGGRKISNKFANSLQEENGQRPTFKTVEKWRDAYGWVERAESLDTELSTALQKEVINERIEMYQEHVEVADSLIAKGKKFLAEHEISDMSDALKAISLGVDIHRASVGQKVLGQKILTMSDDQLTKEINKLLSPPTQNDEFIEADVVDEESTRD